MMNENTKNTKKIQRQYKFEFSLSKVGDSFTTQIFH